MSFDRGGVERQCDGVFAWLGKGLEDHPPSSAPSPAIEAIVYSRVGTIVTRTNAPTRARLQHLNDATDNPPVVVARRPRQSRRQMRLNTRPLPIVQPKQPFAHSLAPPINPQAENHKELNKYRP